jgi:hypothetical protein
MVKSGRLTPPKMAEMLGQMPKSAVTKEGEHPDSYILQWAQKNREDKGFVEWTSFEHPTLGPVEIGGFIPYLRTNPPPSLMASTLEFHTDFYLNLLDRIPELKLLNTRVDALGDGLYDVTVFYTNPGWFPTSTSQGRRARTAWPIRVELKTSESQTVFSGQRITTIPFINGSGDVKKAEWTLKAKKGSEVTITAKSPRLGSVTTTVVLE